MVLKAHFWKFELRGHEKKKKKISTIPLTSKSQVRAYGVNFGKIKIFVFMVLNAEVQTYELRGHEKKKKKISPNPLTSKLQVWTYEVNYVQIKIFFFFFFFFGLKSTGPDL